MRREGGEIAGALKAKLEIAQRRHPQRRDSRNKLWALHAAEVKPGRGQGQHALGVRPEGLGGRHREGGLGGGHAIHARGAVRRRAQAQDDPGALAGAFAGLHGLARHRRNDAADAIAPSSTSC